MTGNEKMALGSIAGLGALIALAFAFSKTAQAATGGSGTAPANLDPNSTLGQAATAMAAQLNSAGYCKSAMSTYQAFQTAAAAGMSYAGNVDGYPGTQTMAALNSALTSMGQPTVTLQVYPWLASGGYDNTNAPASFNNC
jgi:hypothetical protein